VAAATVLCCLKFYPETGMPLCCYAVVKGKNPGYALCCLQRDTGKPTGHHLYIRFINVPRAESGRITPVPPQPFFHFRRITAGPSDKRWYERHARHVPPTSPAIRD